MGCCGFSGPTVPEMTATEATNQLSEGAALIDVREPFEWDTGHAPQARYHRLSSLPATADSLPRDRTLIVICRSGNRSATATRFLRGQGFDAVNLRGGMGAWVAAGLPVIHERGQPGAVA